VLWVDILLLLALIVVLSFGWVLIRGAPYLPTLRKQIKCAFELADLKPGATIIELGSGDGRVLIAAAKAGLKAVGYELNPLLFIYSRIRTRRFGKQIKVIFGDFWLASWPRADAIYVFQLSRLMDRVERKIRQEGLENVIVISFAFKFKNLDPIKQKDGVYLYRLPK
jgi:SAM-dependent methyltransferase